MPWGIHHQRGICVVLEPDQHRQRHTRAALGGARMGRAIRTIPYWRNPRRACCPGWYTLAEQMRRMARLVNYGATLALLGALLVAPAATSAQQYPAFLDDVRKAIVSMEGYAGVFTSPGMILSFAHGKLGRLPPGTALSVTFRELWEALDPEGARAQSLAPDRFRRAARLLCVFADLDVAWVELLTPAPEGATPVVLSRNFTSRLYVLPVLRGVPRVVTASFTGRYGHVQGVDIPLPTVEMQGATDFRGWSGSPVVNDRGEVVGLISGGDRTGSIQIALPVRTCDR